MKAKGHEKADRFMQVKNEAQTGLAAEIKIIPGWAWTLAAVGFLAVQIIVNIGLIFQAPGWTSPPMLWGVPMGILAGTVLSGYLLLIGYVNRDAGRRGMSRIIWTLVTILIPNGLGIILYFILRQPLRKSCPQCGSALQSGFNFCPRCNCKLGPNCLHCQRAVSGDDLYCPYCGTSLRNQTGPEQTPAELNLDDRPMV